ncbi:MAG TPA: asparaginase domain-containing protein [Gammaproteobacteria bacterium]|jgi:L-asparaginase|nr:asparaginase domain-containing protein [Gammaproteobacteria bacterium]
MKIDIFTTGGTIDKTYFDAKSDYKIGESQIDAILEEAEVNFDYEVRALCRKDSLDLTDEDRAMIREAVAASDSAHVLITHGTDTMATTADRLKDIGGKTIVLTGALAPAKFRASDATFNIGGAVAAAQSLPAGVYIFMNGCVFEAGKVHKNQERRRFEAL